MMMSDVHNSLKEVSEKIDDTIGYLEDEISNVLDALEIAYTCLLDAIEDAPPTPTSDHILALESAIEAHAGPAHEKRALVDLLDIVREV